MNKQTLKALLGSIVKWHKIVIKKGVDNGRANCPLCQLFLGCYKCLVNLKSKKSCKNTPYEEWENHLNDEHNFYIYPRKIKCPICIKLAKQELRFLINLLPVKLRKPVRETLKGNLTTINKKFKEYVSSTKYNLG